MNKTRQKPNVDAQKMLNYGKLPNNKYTFNCRLCNDIYLNIVEMNEPERNRIAESHSKSANPSLCLFYSASVRI